MRRNRNSLFADVCQMCMGLLTDPGRSICYDCNEKLEAQYADEEEED